MTTKRGAGPRVPVCPDAGPGAPMAGNHADDCPAVGGDGGMYRVLATIHPKWRAWCRPGVCNCGRFYRPKETKP